MVIDARGMPRRGRRLTDDWQGAENVRHRLRGSGGSLLAGSKSERTASPGEPVKCWPELYVRVMLLYIRKL